MGNNLFSENLPLDPDFLRVQYEQPTLEQITADEAAAGGGVLLVAQGGTGANTAAAARVNLGTAASGANNDITSLAGLTTPLSIAQGGTNAITAAAARTSLSAAQSGSNSDITSLNTISGSLILSAAASVFKIKEGSNAAMGVATLVGGTVTVNNTRVTISSRIFLTHQNNSGAVGFPTISARVAGTSFTILSSSGTDTSDVGYLIIEPA
jgi:hypothetical protein